MQDHTLSAIYKIITGKDEDLKVDNSELNQIGT
jgi:hypothetical protein